VLLILKIFLNCRIGLIMVVLAKYNLIRNMIHKIVLNSFVILQRLENNTNI